ncbi:fimbriae secretion channel subunit B TadB [Pontimonas salivibrio]|uniref:Fimbriae secretion channel subunit B TadB n=1 Tax=Pontimonas salivibrio TaxID=1159327 RepID=A0A2L2BS28_9MICO|nr:type II secretion system F family protein [Pontimonas salivibrio]AVG24450.1 fimbriae secretion channel subunit B TadB [Pontimonas salivibrio]
MTWWEALAVVSGLGLAAGILVLFSVFVTSADPWLDSSQAAHVKAEPGPGKAIGMGGVRAGVMTRGVGQVQQLLDQAGWGSLRAPVVMALWVLVAVLLAALVGVFIPIPVLMPLAMVGFGLAGRALLQGRIEARQRRLRAAWPGLVDHIRQVIRSGGGVAEAVAGLEHHSPGELRGFFAAFGREVEAGTRVDSALAQLKDEVADPVADRIIEALRMAHEVGGRELPSVLHSLQASVRADIAVREDALAKQSWIRAASRLGVAAPWLVLVVLSGRTETVQAYDSPAGVAVIVGGALLSALAFRMMSRLGRLPVDQRWFASPVLGVG